MFDTLAEIVATYGPFFIAIMGIVVSVTPNIARKVEKWWWVIAFVMVGAVVSTASYYEMHSANVMQQKIYNFATGANGYVYVDVYKPFPKGKTVFVLINPRDDPVFNVKIYLCATQDSSDSSRQVINLERDVVRSGVTSLEQNVEKIGYYSAIIWTRGTQTSEILLIKSTDSDQPSRDLDIYNGRGPTGLLFHKSE